MYIAINSANISCAFLEQGFKNVVLVQDVKASDAHRERLVILAVCL